MNFELKKIKGNTVYKISLLLIVLLILGVSFVSIRSDSFIEDINSTSHIKGIKASKEWGKVYEDAPSKELTVDYIQKALRDYASYSDTVKGELNLRKDYPGVLDILTKAYGNYEDSLNDINGVEINEVDNFYARNRQVIKSYMEEKGFSQRKIDKADNYLKKIKIPYTLSYVKPWINLWKAMTIVDYFLCLVAVVLSSRLFSLEKEQKMEELLSTRKSRAGLVIGRNKVKAICLAVTQLYFISSLSLFLIKVFTTGLSGMGSQIQIEYVFSIYPVNFLVATVGHFLVGWIAIVFVSILAGWINILTMNTTTSLTISTVTIFFPLLLGKLLGELQGPVSKFIGILPINNIDFIKNIKSLPAYNLLGIPISSMAMGSLLAILVFIISFFVMPLIFNSKLKK
ncbi:MAG: hypothetical protein Q4E76_02875 [Tissierellia bacterium]|nr:hypothetical protein [Tissierellia bacterium]